MIVYKTVGQINKSQSTMQYYIYTLHDTTDHYVKDTPCFIIHFSPSFLQKVIVVHHFLLQNENHN